MPIANQVRQPVRWQSINDFMSLFLLFLKNLDRYSVPELPFGNLQQTLPKPGAVKKGAAPAAAPPPALTYI